MPRHARASPSCRQSAPLCARWPGPPSCVPGSGAPGLVSQRPCAPVIAPATGSRDHLIQRLAGMVKPCGAGVVAVGQGAFFSTPFRRPHPWKGGGRGPAPGDANGAGKVDIKLVAFEWSFTLHPHQSGRHSPYPMTPLPGHIADQTPRLHPGQVALYGGLAGSGHGLSRNRMFPSGIVNGVDG